MNNYRIPTIDEFVEGFEYEINLESWQIVQFTKDKLQPISDVYEVWEDKVVPKFESGIVVEQYGDNTVSWVRNPDEEERQYFSTIKSCLENNQIRVKI